MNQRIKELADKTADDMTGALNIPDEFCKKFAEFLINECAETVQDFVDHRFPASEYPVRLRRYFGVSE